MRWIYDTRQDGGVVEFHSDPLVVEDLVVAGSDRRQPGGVAHLYAFERTTGKLRWRYRVDLGVAADVLRVGPNVYAVTLQDELLCLDWKTGELIWKSATAHPNDDFFLNSAPAASGSQVFFGGLDGAVYAFDASSGQVLWKRELGGRVSTTLLIADGSLLAGTSNRHLYRLDPKTGSATADLATDEVPRGRLLAADGTLLAFFGEGTLACLDSSLRAIRWRESTLGPWSSSKPYLWDHAVIAGNERGELFAFRLSDGSRLWSQRFDGVIRGVGSSEGTLYVGTLKGKVFAARSGS